ncbi:O-acyltransferase [Hamiltosporidium magnivora]|uniref:O-acyltransferase n=1 Tax=Hamiltosporidium magnivora TaxID=148818 RepID=A0A4Q9LFF7_9MICR|nr:O-acyltransferase [Hamiltosporidium magnivora]
MEGSKILVNKNIKKRKIDGLKNLSIIISFIACIRFMFANYKKHGILITLPLQSLLFKDIQGLFYILIMNFFKCLFAFCNEYYFNNLIFKLIFLLSFEIFIGYLNVKYIQNVYFSLSLLILSVSFLMKTISFHIYFYRILTFGGGNEKFNDASKKVTHKTCSIENTKTKHFASKYTKPSFSYYLYFICIPTLCFRKKYKIRKNRNWISILNLFLKFLISILLIMFIMDQYAVPCIYNIENSRDIISLIENVLDLSISTTFLWLIFFYSCFYCFLNILARITKYKNDKFYKKWWNVSSIRQFWSCWNIPVHEWFKEVVYIPLVQNNYSKSHASCFIFFLSAILHEYVIGASTKMFKGWIFLSIFSQIFLIKISDYTCCFPNLGNYLFWCSFCIIGQPMCMFLYYRALYLKNVPLEMSM